MEVPPQASDNYLYTSESTSYSSVSHSVVVDGQWSAWSPYSSCSSECITKGQSNPVGLMISTRKCDNPAPSHRGKTCDGITRNVKLCDASQVNFNKISSKFYLNILLYYSYVCCHYRQDLFQLKITSVIYVEVLQEKMAH